MKKSVVSILASYSAFMDLKAPKAIRERNIDRRTKAPGSVGFLKAPNLVRNSLKLTIKQDCIFRVMTIEPLQN